MSVVLEATQDARLRPVFRCDLCQERINDADEGISRKADEDNDNDEYHQKVSPVDVWAEYARLRDEEGWTQQGIADAKGVDQPIVNRRLKFHTLPAKVKGWICDGDLTEGHLEAISGVYATSHMAAWLSSEEAWEELAALVVRAKKKDGKAKSVAATREDVKTWKAMIAAAKGEQEAIVSRRIGWHRRLPDAIKALVVSGVLTETHLIPICAVIVSKQLAPWLTAEAAWLALCELVVYGQTKNGKKSVRAAPLGGSRPFAARSENCN